MSKKKGKKKPPKPEPSVLAGTLTVPRDEELIGRAVAPPAGRGMTRVEQLISEGASPDAKDTKGNPAINNAARKGHFSIVQTLRRAGADIEAPNPSGRTAMMGAAENGHSEVVGALLGWGVDIHAVDNEGQTALHLAAQNSHLDVVRLLLAAGADRELKNKQGKTALDLVGGAPNLMQEGKRAEVAKSLVDTKPVPKDKVRELCLTHAERLNTNSPRNASAPVPAGALVPEKKPYEKGDKPYCEAVLRAMGLSKNEIASQLTHHKHAPTLKDELAAKKLMAPPDQRKLTEAELRARLRQEKAEAKKVDLDELVEKVAGEDRRDPYKELAKNPSSLAKRRAAIEAQVEAARAAQRAKDGVAEPSEAEAVGELGLELSAEARERAKREKARRNKKLKKERQRARQAGTSRNVIEERPSDASGLNDAIAALKRDTALPTNAPPEPAPAPVPALEEPEDEEGRSMTPRLELEPPEKIAPSTVVTARTATFSRKEGSSVEKHRYGSLKRHDQLLAAVKKTMAAHPGMGSKKIAAHVKVEYPELEAGTKEVREVVKSAIEQAKQAAASTPDLEPAIPGLDVDDPVPEGGGGPGELVPDGAQSSSAAYPSLEEADTGGSDGSWSTHHPGVVFVGRDLAPDSAARRDGPGAHVVASSAIAANTTIMTEAPFVSVLLDDLAGKATVCHQCYRTIPESRAANAACCSSCGSVFYCTAACMATSAALHSGADECSTLRRLRGNFEQSRDVRLLVRMQHSHPFALATPPPDSEEFQQMSQSSGQRFEDLMYHKMTQRETQRARRVVRLANDILPTNIQMDEKVGLGAVARIRANSFSLLGEQGQPVGVGLFLAASSLNHSCTPNLCVTNDGPQLSFTTIGAIKPGDELTIAYADGALPTTDRQAKLNKVYGFSCACIRCTDSVYSNLAPAECMVSKDCEEDAVLLEARRLYRELRSCTAQGAVSRGLQCARALATEPRFEAVLHPHARAVFQHIAVSHTTTLQCSAVP